MNINLIIFSLDAIIIEIKPFDLLECTFHDITFEPMQCECEAN